MILAYISTMVLIIILVLLIVIIIGRKISKAVSSDAGPYEDDKLAATMAQNARAEKMAEVASNDLPGATIQPTYKGNTMPNEPDVISDNPTKTTVGDDPSAPEVSNRKPVQHFTVSQLGRVRYSLEHGFLPERFFESPKDMINFVAAEGALLDGYNRSLAEEALKPFPQNAIKISGTTFAGGHKLLMAELPYPEYTPLCYRIYFVTDSEYKKLAYYTIERGIDCDFICEWDHGRHINHHEVKSADFSTKEAAVMKAMEVLIIEDYYKKKYALGK